MSGVIRAPIQWLSHPSKCDWAIFFSSAAAREPGVLSVIQYRRRIVHAAGTGFRPREDSPVCCANRFPWRVPRPIHLGVMSGPGALGGAGAGSNRAELGRHVAPEVCGRAADLISQVAVAGPRMSDRLRKVQRPWKSRAHRKSVDLLRRITSGACGARGPAPASDRYRYPFLDRSCVEDSGPSCQAIWRGTSRQASRKPAPGFSE